MIFHTRDLDQFVKLIDEKFGDINNYPDKDKFVLKYDTQIDLQIDPFGRQYFDMQTKLYSEISGRNLDQEANEQFKANTNKDNNFLANTSNPLGSKDISYISKHMRAISAMLEIANFPVGASILDVGAGWGLTSELAAYSGAEVTALDINPEFTSLISSRAKRLSLPIRTSTSNFDRYSTSEKFDGVIFYESLHHATQPLELLKRYANIIKPKGKIVFCGEPINDMWPDWGLRTDAESVYVMRKYGWFESGWSERHIIQVFEHAGFVLKLLPWSGLRNGIIGIAQSKRDFSLDSFNLGEGSPAHLYKVYTESKV
jgi:2-polyprenyl-3-methyl-5-hydroxy-6-metoxy-1,4-benzoquinol methylase